MLTRIEIDGFKTFENFALDLNPFLVVVGPNGAGKSNLFDAIRVLSRLAMDDVRTALAGSRGEPHELFRVGPDGEFGRTMRLAVEVLLPRTIQDPWGGTALLRHTRLRYELEIERRMDTRRVERFIVVRETAAPIRRKDDRWRPHGEMPSAAFRRAFMLYGRSTPLLSMKGSGGSASFHIHQDEAPERTRSAAAAETTILSSITSVESPHLFALREEIRSWTVLHVSPAALRLPSPANAPDVLLPDGSNLPTVLARIESQTRTENSPHGALADIGAHLAGLIPGVAQVDVEEDEANHRYRIRVKVAGEHPFPAEVVSDGTLRLLAILAVLHDPERRGLACLEEPENGIHPVRIESLLELLKAMATRADEDAYDAELPLSQLLVSSHSPVVLSHLAPDEYVIADSVWSVGPGAPHRLRRTRMRYVMADEKADAVTLRAARGEYASRFDVEQYLRSVVDRAG
jgi:predicted ATPase